MAEVQLRALLEPMADLSVRESRTDRASDGEAEDFVERLRDIVGNSAQNSESGFVTLLIPLNWQLSQVLGLPFLSAAAPPEDWALSEAAAGRYSGQFEDVPAFHFPHLPHDVVYVVDLSSYVTAESWRPSDDEAVTVTVLSEEEARKRAQQDPGKDKIGENEIVRRWRRTALITVDPGLRLNIKRDESAVAALRLPASLTWAAD